MHSELFLHDDCHTFLKSKVLSGCCQAGYPTWTTAVPNVCQNGSASSTVPRDGSCGRSCEDLLKARDLDDSIAADVEKELAKLKRQQKAGPTWLSHAQAASAEAQVLDQQDRGWAQKALQQLAPTLDLRCLRRQVRTPGFLDVPVPIVSSVCHPSLG